MASLHDILQQTPAGFTQYRDSTDEINAATMQGAHDEKEVYDAQRGGLLGGQTQQPPVYNQIQRKLIGDIVDAKGAYALGQALGGEAGQAQMANAAQAANMARAVLGGIGGDASAYGSDVSYEQARQNLAVNDARALNEIFAGDMSSGDKYDQVYDDLRGRGVSHDRADREASRAAAEYQRDRINRLDAAFQLYGKSGANAINGMGIQILNRLADEDEGMANAYLQTHGLPKDEYVLGNQLRLSDDQQQKTLARMGVQYDYGQRAADAAQQRNMQMASYQDNLRRSMAIFNANLEAQTRHMKQAEKEAYIFQQWYQLTGDESQARALTAQSLLGLGNEKASSGKSDAERSNMLKEIRSRIADIEKNYAGDMEALNKDTEYQQLKQTYSGLLYGNDNNRSNGTSWLPNITGDWNTDSAMVREMWRNAEARGKSPKEISDGIYDYFIDKGASEEYARAAANSVLPDEPESSTLPDESEISHDDENNEPASSSNDRKPEPEPKVERTYGEDPMAAANSIVKKPDPRFSLRKIFFPSVSELQAMRK